MTKPKPITGNIIVDKLEDIRFASRGTMRYETLGDWYDSGYIEVYDRLTDKEKLAVGVHELIEMILLHLQGVNEAMVNEWDTADTNGAYDPAMYDKDERYKKAHQFAEMVERKIIETAGIKWSNYDRKLSSLPVHYEKGKIVPRDTRKTVAYRMRLSQRASKAVKGRKRVNGKFVKDD